MGNRMKWEKLGLIFTVDGHHSWMNSHAALPVPMKIANNVFRIFISTRDRYNRSHGAYVDLDMESFRIVSISSKPVLKPGAIGLFDDCGVSLSCYVSQLNSFYYLGWNVLTTVPFKNEIGISQLKDRCILQRNKKIPVVRTCEKEPYSFGYPFVLKIGDRYRMWYDTNLNWSGDTVDNYHFVLRSATSLDGVFWEKDYTDCIPLREGERSISRPCVINGENKFQMWYSINRNGKYLLGYADSPDGISWNRKDDEVGIFPSSSGWDSEEIEYPYVFDHKGERYMLYNGNGYGKSGFGIARLKK